MSNNAIDQTKPEADYDDDDDASDSGASTEAPKTNTDTTKEAPNRYEKLERLKREKRLAMNRECARARRRRKKMRMEVLENRVQELTQKNGRICEANDALRARVAQLEAQLGGARPGMSLGVSAPDVSASSFMGARMSGFSPEANQAMMSEKLDLQRRAAMVGLGGASTGLGRLTGNQNGNLDTLRYIQLMQAKNAMGEDAAAAMQHAFLATRGMRPGNEY